MQEHRKIVDFTVEHYKAASMFQKNVINAMNLVSTKILAGDTPPDIDYTSAGAFTGLEKLTEQVYKQALGKIYIDIKDVDWNLTPASTKSDGTTKVESVSKPKKKSEIVQEDTPKEYLYLQAPKYPRLDTSKVVLDDIVGGERFYIHPSLPIIPEKQCDVSCTTDVNKMTTKDLLKLFPNHLIRTRPAVMYEPCGDIPMDKDLGLLLPIEGFTPEQVRDNIIKYPHLFKISRLYNDQEYNLYGHIEIDGELHEITEVWNNLPISKLVPFTTEYVKEYVIRRYLLERDNGVEHKFPMRGTLMPYLTLFAPSSFYNEDPAKLARSCVEARVSFFKSRNPYLERYEDVKQGLIPPNVSNTCPFKAYCRGKQCLHICPKVSEFEYLLERNNLLGNKNVYSYSPKMLQKALECITSADGCYKVVIR